MGNLLAHDLIVLVDQLFEYNIPKCNALTSLTSPMRLLVQDKEGHSADRAVAVSGRRLRSARLHVSSARPRRQGSRVCHTGVLVTLRRGL